ncbi:MAG: DUF4168 domain-containing protein [Alphaproteobacteria bacterium]|nr:DUF4168 domain-containing protein [Alphaproteobacteria bacterium]
MLTLKNKILMAATAVGLLSAGGAATVANAQDSYIPPQGQQQQQMNVTDAQLQEFAKAQAAVSQIQAQFQNQAANITTQEEMTALQQQANQQMVQAIEQTDLNVEQYNLIASAVQTNPEVQKKYMDMIQ